MAAGAGIASNLITRMAARPVLIAGLVVTVTALLRLARAPTGGSYVVDLLPAFLALGLGCGMVYVTLQVAAFAGISDQDAGVGAGLINTSQEAGGALGLAVVATIAYSGISAKLAAADGDATLLHAAQAAANHRAFLAADHVPHPHSHTRPRSGTQPAAPGTEAAWRHGAVQTRTDAPSS